MALILYPTAEMQQAVAWVYASIMKFLHLAVCFYKEGRLEHSIKAIFQPWALRFQDVYDELADRSVRVKELADSAAKAELRDIHLDILDGRKVLNEVNARVDTLYSAQKTLRALFEEKMSDQTHLLSSKCSPSHGHQTTLFEAQFRHSTVSRNTTGFVPAETSDRPDSLESATINVHLAKTPFVWGVPGILSVNATQTLSLFARQFASEITVGEMG